MDLLSLLNQQAHNALGYLRNSINNKCKQQQFLSAVGFGWINIDLSLQLHIVTDKKIKHSLLTEWLIAAWNKSVLTGQEI